MILETAAAAFAAKKGSKKVKKGVGAAAQALAGGAQPRDAVTVGISEATGLDAGMVKGAVDMAIDKAGPAVTGAAKHVAAGASGLVGRLRRQHPALSNVQFPS